MAPPVTPPAPLPPAEPPPASAEPIPAQTQPPPPLYKSARATLVSGSIESVMVPWSWGPKDIAIDTILPYTFAGRGQLRAFFNTSSHPEVILPLCVSLCVSMPETHKYMLTDTLE
jgi:hypothetical protein